VRHRPLVILDPIEDFYAITDAHGPGDDEFSRDHILYELENEEADHRIDDDYVMPAMEEKEEEKESDACSESRPALAAASTAAPGHQVQLTEDTLEKLPSDFHWMSKDVDEDDSWTDGGMSHIDSTGESSWDSASISRAGESWVSMNDNWGVASVATGVDNDESEGGLSFASMLKKNSSSGDVQKATAENTPQAWEQIDRKQREYRRNQRKMLMEKNKENKEEEEDVEVGHEDVWQKGNKWGVIALTNRRRYGSASRNSQRGR